jgi:hypothetical protein
MSKSKPKSHYDRWPVDQCVLVLSPVWGSWPHVWVYICAVVFYLGSVLRLLLGSGQQWGGVYRSIAWERVYRAVAQERVSRAVAPSNAGYVGMFETRLSVCMCSGVLYGVCSEAVARQQSTMRWCFLFGPFRVCYRKGRMSAVISVQKDPTNCEGMKWVTGTVFLEVKRSRCEAKIWRIFLSIQCPWLFEGLRARLPGLDSQQGQDISLLHNVQTDSVAHPSNAGCFC